MSLLHHCENVWPLRMRVIVCMFVTTVHVLSRHSVNLCDLLHIGHPQFRRQVHSSVLCLYDLHGRCVIARSF